MCGILLPQSTYIAAKSLPHHCIHISVVMLHSIPAATLRAAGYTSIYFRILIDFLCLLVMIKWKKTLFKTNTFTDHSSLCCLASQHMLSNLHNDLHPFPIVFGNRQMVLCN